MIIEYITREKKKGVFLSLSDWKKLQKELTALQAKFEVIARRRKEMAENFKKSKKEKLVFSSEISQLKSMIK